SLAELILPSTIVLPNDKVLISGGYGLFNIETTDLWDPVTGMKTAGARMSLTRAGHTSTLLHNGKVLIFGGKGFFGQAAEVYDWKTGKFSSTPASVLPHGGASFTVLASGKVLLVDVSKTAELYEPSRLQGEACKENADCESGFCTDGVCCD